MKEDRVKLLPMQKINALANKYYSFAKWKPKNGDYYTNSRADLELYQIVDEDDQYFYTVYCHVENCQKEKWEKDRFLHYFGIHRVHVPEWIFERIKD